MEKTMGLKLNRNPNWKGGETITSHGHAEWIEPFFDIQGIPVFMKDACSKIIDRPLRQEWPEGYLNEKNK
jgi:hypothetical protein